MIFLLSASGIFCQMNYYLECFCQMSNYYSGFPRIRNHFFGCSLLFSNNSLLFYSLFYMKIEIYFLYKGVSYSREPAASHLVARYTYPLLQCFINYLLWSTSRGSPLKESVGGLTLFRSHLSKFLSTVGSISFKLFVLLRYNFSSLRQF